MSPRYAGRFYDVFADGCVTYEFDVARGPHITLIDELLRAVHLYPRRLLCQELRDQFGITHDPKPAGRQERPHRTDRQGRRPHHRRQRPFDGRAYRAGGQYGWSILKREIVLPPEHLFPPDEWRIVEARLRRWLEKAVDSLAHPAG